MRKEADPARKAGRAALAEHDAAKLAELAHSNEEWKLREYEGRIGQPRAQETSASLDPTTRKRLEADARARAGEERRAAEQAQVAAAERALEPSAREAVRGGSTSRQQGGMTDTSRQQGGMWSRWWYGQ